jgi:hypothetical protein
LAVGGTGGTGASTLVYTWSSVSSPSGIAFPTFSLNGTNGALDDAATIYGPGVYVFSVAVTDGNNLSAGSSTFTIVSQVPTTVTVTPATLSLPVNSSYQFNATALDQFGNPLAQQSFTWSVTGTNNTISPGGLLVLNNPTGTSVVTAADGSPQGSAVVTTLGASTPPGGGSSVTSVPLPVMIFPVSVSPVAPISKAPGNTITHIPSSGNTVALSPVVVPTLATPSLPSSTSPPGSLPYGPGFPLATLSGKSRWLGNWQLGPLRFQ